MTSSDKTKSQLIDSMRMSKGGTNEAPATKDAGKGAAVKKKTSKAKRAPAKAAAKKPAAKKTAVSAGQGRASIGSDRYESGKRIWPD
jgi:hypothetical protein